MNSTTCTNDSNGNQLSCGSSYHLTYNARNQTTSASSPNGNLTHQYVGADSTQRVATSGSHATPYTYNALGLGTEKDASGNLIAYTRDNKGNLIAMRTSSGNYTYLYDGLGSVVALMGTNYAGVVNTYVYDPYGVTEHQTGSQYNPWQFAGGYFDASTLYYKYGTRYYDRFGRWTQQDPQPSANPYLYANDDPVNVVDSNGQASTPLCAAALGGIVLGVVSAIQSVPGLVSFIGGLLTFAGAVDTGAILATLAALAAVSVAVIVITAVILFAIGAIYAIYATCGSKS